MGQNRWIFIAQFILIILLAVQAHADYTCSDPRYAAPPAFRADGTFNVIQSGDCQLKGAHAGGLTILYHSLVKSTITSNQVNAGPVTDNENGLAGVRFDITDASGDSHGDELSIRSDVRIATDGRTNLVYSRLSKEIKATGDSKNLKQMDVELKVTLSPDGSAAVTLVHEVHVSKPWYAPSGIFEGQVEKSVYDDFLEDRDAFLKETAKDLESAALAPLFELFSEPSSSAGTPSSK